MEVEAEVLEPLELPYADLVLLSSPPSSGDSPPREGLERLGLLSSKVMEALGPSGPGLLCVTGVPGAPALRRALLPLARKLALLGGADRARILKSHGLGTDVPLKNPDRTVSSFAKQLKYMRDPSLELNATLPKHEYENNHIPEANVNGTQDELPDFEFIQLGNTFKQLGFCMMDIGLRLAQLCGPKMGSQELELSILESCMAKGRLIHYHSTLDNIILKEAKKRAKGSKRKPAVFHASVPRGSTAITPLDSGMELQNKQEKSEHLRGESNAAKVRCKTSLSHLWQQWHHDYGIFTVLTSPMFIHVQDMPLSDVSGPFCISSSQECGPPDCHTCLQLLDNTGDKILVVKTPPESFIIQVGESADILSSGNLCSTLHSVCRPVELDNLSRETFVVFLQPAWDKTFSIPENMLASEKVKELISKETTHILHSEGDKANTHLVAARDYNNLKEEVVKQVPSLSSRLKDGMTFAEFSRVTTKQYYGGSGTQSRR